ncbi:MAG TPA: ParB/RepB/Spo0J family partition protein [Noviherbaspirillum sp.]|nr:ParB/RepB/Spo0J family partition protein [Noviherbaspirillum sp.]
MVVNKGEREIEIPLNKVKFDPKQPRQAFHHLDGRINAEDEAYIDELAGSINKNGLIEAITVQELPDGTYLVVVGECRTRAHLKLGCASIRAIVRNDLVTPAKRLLYQLAENVNRKDLSDDEMALAIRQLMEGANGDKPMAQVEIAEYFGKSEGWVSRFVKYGDEELQRVWVKSGIADTVEKVYRLSILPKAAQVDILRRVDLPEGDPDRLEKPLNRNVIDALARDAKANKAASSGKAVTAPPAAVGVSTGKASTLGAASIQEAMEEAAAGGSAAAAVSGNNEGSSLSTGGYVLSDSDRSKLLGSVPMPQDGAGKSERDAVVPPVNCRISVSNVNALLDVLKSNKEILDSFGSVRCELSIPVPIAKLVANQLTGVIVDDQEIPAILQSELSKLK